MSKSSRNENQHLEKSPARSSETAQTPEQAQAQTVERNGSLGGELDKYSAFASELAAQVRALSLLHEQRASFEAKSDALKSEHAGLEQKILDGDAESIADLVLNHDAVALNEVKLSALASRIDRAESDLHTLFPTALLCFGRLHSYVVACTLASAKESVTKLLAPGYSVPEDVLGQIAIATPAFVFISQLKLPSLTHTITRPLAYDQPHWSSLVRAYTAAEKAQLRAETVQSLVSATNELCGAARRLLEAAAQFGEPPEFKCEAEIVVPAQPNPEVLEWLQPLGGSDAEFIAQHCKEAGKDPNHLSAADQRILAALVEERHRMPQSHGVVTAEMIGSTFQES